MAGREIPAGGDLFIVDNSDAEWKVRQYLREWCDISRSFDIATGYFELGSLLALDGEWQKLEKIRILMGDEVSRRTRQALLAGIEALRTQLDRSIEREKEKDDFLTGADAVVEALRRKRIECRVYTRNKFHAKAYITHAKHAVVGASALVGSSNFTLPGLTANVELNVQLRREVDQLQAWYERHWQEAEDVSDEVLRTIERHVAEYPPFDIYARALHEYFRGHEMTAGEWERTESRMFPRLSRYQQGGYQTLLRIAEQYGGAFLCDGVGLGKTFIGLMLIERLAHEGKNIALFVPKAARADVWDSHLERYLPDLRGRSFSRLSIFNHTDLGRAGEFPNEFRRVAEMADAVIVDEAHHFRNPGIAGKGERRPSRYRILFDLVGAGKTPKQVFLLTATPINNKLDDFRHMAELFTRQRDDYFKNRLGIHSLRGHFIRLERDLRRQLYPDAATQPELPIELDDAEAALSDDAIFKALVVQRSRAYVRESQRQEGRGEALFPERDPPRVVDYSVRKTYGRLLDSVDRAFAKKEPLFILGIYYPLAYLRKKTPDVDPLEENRQKAVVGLIRTQFLKRFESSALAFGLSCDRLLLRMLAWVTKHSESAGEKQHLDIWKRKHAETIGYVQQQQLELWRDLDMDEADEDVAEIEALAPVRRVTAEDLDKTIQAMLPEIDTLSRDVYRVEDILSHTYEDMNQLVEFLKELQALTADSDDKLRALVRLLKTDPLLKNEKALIFSEFAETARYLRKELAARGIEGVEEIDSLSKRSRSEVVRRFSPYYNGSSSAELAAAGKKEIRVLISTDVLSEGLNLQDAARLINYDLHWNPVRLMQRIGRVDRRMNPEIEARLVADHPERKPLRGHVAYWNFLPPEDLDELLRLYTKVSHKTLRISKTFGIEGRKLLRPEDDFEALKEFNHAYEGEVSAAEKMHLEYERLLREHPGLAARLDGLPGRLFSGKAAPRPESRGVFFCYRLPGRTPTENDAPPGEDRWDASEGLTAWYLFDIGTGRIAEDPAGIVEWIRCAPDTPRATSLPRPRLSEIRALVEKRIRDTHLKRVQAPAGVKPVLKCWMELS
mgnify:CR=1 FL=1